jgi:hypothetical protein
MGLAVTGQVQVAAVGQKVMSADNRYFAPLRSPLSVVDEACPDGRHEDEEVDYGCTLDSAPLGCRGRGTLAGALRPSH